MLDRLARVCVRRHWWVVLAWLAALLLAFVLNRAVGGELSDDFSFGHVEAENAHTLLAERFRSEAGPQVALVFHDEDGLRAGDGKAAVERVLGEVRRLRSIESVDSPNYATDGDTAVATAHIRWPSPEHPDVARYTVAFIADHWTTPDFRVGVSGEGFVEFTAETGPAEIIGLVAAVVVLLLTFGSVVAAGVPLVAALFALGVALLSLTVLARWINVPVMAPAMASMVGLGVGIDYSLFILTRHRPALSDGASVEDAAAMAVRTAGRAVLFAGATVVVSMLGLLLVGLDVVRGLAVGAALAVLFTMVAAVTLLPALLGIIGHRLDRLRLRRARPVHEARSTASLRWSRFVQRHSVLAAVAGTALLLLLAAPLLSLELGIGDAGNNPEGTASRRGYDLMAEGFGPGYNGPLLLVATVPDGTPALAIDRIERAVAATDGVELVVPPVANDDGSVVLLTTIPTTSPQSAETSSLVGRLRQHVLPPVLDRTGIDVVVGGPTAVDVDLSKRISSRLPAFVTAVLALSFVLLLAVFRSVLLPLKAVLMNLLSIGAAYGVVIAVFQWGWGAELIGIHRTGPIEPFFPMFLFAILFGLSMDYEVFILTRVHEEYVRTGDNSRAVADGLAATARVITAAAAIMVVIFGSFMTSDDRILKLFGLGLTVAILVDATVVRLVVVPATMELMGRANWWLPRWLDRRLPRIELEADPAVT